MRIGECYGSGKFGLSIEIFPPKTEKGEAALMRAVEKLVQYQPGFISCTYGAGGSTREKTLDLTVRIREAFDVSTVAHLTCVGSTRAELHAWLSEAARRGVESIMALRGDPPKGQEWFVAVEGGFRYANELIAFIRAEFPQFGIGVAGYPETHQEAPSPEADLENLKRKVEAGGDVVVTQLFYDNRDFFSFRERYERAGIRVPLVPGILPVTNVKQIQRIASLCGAKLPKPFLEDLLAHEDDEAAQEEIGVAQATRQCQELIEGGVPGIHFYCLNRSSAVAKILDALAPVESPKSSAGS